MVSADVLLETAAPTSLLSKFARSPSRKHKPRPSSESIQTDATLSAAVAAGKSTRYRPRPGTLRTKTTPDTAVTLNAIKAELAARKDSNATDTLVGSPNSENKMLAMMAMSMAAGPEQVAPVLRKKTLAVPEVPAINGAALALNPVLANASAPNPNTLHQHIHDTSGKRIATLDYMRKAHEGRIFWFNTVQFSKSDISRLPSYAPNRLSRRATGYLLLGMSIPAVLDAHPPPRPKNTPATNAAIASDYLRSLNALLAEFESFQQLHPADGSSASSLSRARIPQMFKRSVTSRPRKSSGTPVTEIGAPLQQSTSAPTTVPEGGQGHSHTPSLETTYTHPSFASSAVTLVPATPIGPSTSSSFPPPSTGQPTFPPPPPADAPNSTLLPNEGPYTYLLTPPLPFAPDFFAVFSTLCDVLIEAYQRLQHLLNSPGICTPSMSDAFNKVDSRLRKVMVGGIIREFETSSREAVRKEMMGLQRAVFSGLMAA